MSFKKWSESQSWTIQ